MPALALVLHMLIAAGSYPLLAFVARSYPAAGVLALRATLGAALLVLAAVLGGARAWPPREDLRRLIVVGIAGVPVNQGFLLLGLQSTEVSHAAILYALTPVFVAVSARVWLGERLGKLGSLGVLLSLLGALVVLQSRGGGGALLRVADRGPLQGDLYILVGVIGWVIYTVMSRPLVLRHGVLAVTAWAHLLGALAAWPIGGVMMARAGAPSTEVLAAVAALAVGTSFVNYLLWNYALQRLKTAAVAVSANLQPPLAALVAWTLGSERPGWLLAVGGLLVLAGVSLTLARPRPG